MDLFNNDYTVGRYEVHFDRFQDGTKTGTGERYMGNTSSITETGNPSMLDHYDMDHGTKVKDASILLQVDQSINLVVDDISPENLALWWLGDATKLTRLAQTAQTQNIKAALGRTFQIGTSAANPAGVADVNNVTVKNGASTVASANNYEVDLRTGRLYIESDATDIEEDDNLTITYDVEAGSSDLVIAKGRPVYGALRFVAFDSGAGSLKDHYYPYVMLQPNGDIALKTDQWQTLGFTAQILKLNSVTERAYISQRNPVA